MTSKFNARAFMDDFVSSMNSKQPQKLLAHYAENAEIKDPSTPQPLRGKANVAKNFEQWSGAFSEMEFKVKDIVESGSNVALLYEAQGRHTGEIELAPGEPVPATNKVVKMEIAEFLTIDGDGKVTRDHTIFDVASMMAQLGLMPSPQGATQVGKSSPVRTR